jgi:murein DD-endopeptidase MepM/ murein hydrolase activator NlpD
MLPVRALPALALLVGAGLVARLAGYLGGPRTAPAVAPARRQQQVVHDTLQPRETLSQLFTRQGVNDVDWSGVSHAVRSFDPSRVRAGTVFQFSRWRDESSPHAVAVRVSWDTRLVMRKDTGGAWATSTEHITWRAEPFIVEGVVQTSVSDAVTEAIGDEILPRTSRIELVWSLAAVYDWVVDFSRDVRAGDRFKVLAERMISTEGEVRYSRILAARLEVGPRPLYAYRYDDAEGRDAFWDEQGKSMKRVLLRAPLEYKHIGSGFSKSRFHPILHYYRPHLGIDFGAAYGAPVRSVGKGTVTFAGRSGGYGNMVEIRHDSRTTTRYGHLSEFGPGVHAGAHVEQSQMIGRVGASGLATSPHLHYELRRDGRAVNPRHLGATGEGRPIAAARRAAFDEEKRRLESMLESSASAPAARVD